MTKRFEVLRRPLNALACYFAREFPFVEGCFGAANERERERGTIVGDMVLEYSAKDELVKPEASLRELGS
jgi:hypothetical protein